VAKCEVDEWDSNLGVVFRTISGGREYGCGS